MARLGSPQSVLEERGQRVEGAEVDAVVEIRVTGAENNHQFLMLQRRATVTVCHKRAANQVVESIAAYP